MLLRVKIITVVFGISLGLSCGWDYDTIQMEKKAFPTVYELIAGKFLRHSSEFYYWRAKDREVKITQHKDSLKLYDDLGVAYDKIGQHQKAIETMLKSDQIQSGRYETYANLGTFYIHNQEFEKGIVELKKAIKINPDAHFGREIYQIHLVEYIIQQKKDSLQLPLTIKNSDNNFYHYLYKHFMKNEIAKGSTMELELSKAIKGLAGMMHFGQYRSPILLEALGDLLLKAEGYGGAGHLGARAYLKASFEVKSEESAKIYRKKASDAIEKTRVGGIALRNVDSAQLARMMEDARPMYSVKHLEDALQYEVYQAEKWFSNIRKDELLWIQKRINVDSAFSATYFDSISPLQYKSERHAKEVSPVNDSIWLAIQMNNPQYENNYFISSTLDSTFQAEVDSLFAAKYPKAAISADDTNAEEKTDKEEKKGTSMLWYFAFALILIGIYMVWKDYRNKKQNLD